MIKINLKNMGESKLFAPSNEQAKGVHEDFVPLDEIEVPINIDDMLPPEEDWIPLPENIRKKVEKLKEKHEKKHKKTEIA